MKKRTLGIALLSPIPLIPVICLTSCGSDVFTKRFNYTVNFTDGLVGFPKDKDDKFDSLGVNDKVNYVSSRINATECSNDFVYSFKKWLNDSFSTEQAAQKPIDSYEGYLNISLTAGKIEWYISVVLNESKNLYTNFFEASPPPDGYKDVKTIMLYSEIIKTDASNDQNEKFSISEIGKDELAGDIKNFYELTKPDSPNGTKEVGQIVYSLVNTTKSTRIAEKKVPEIKIYSYTYRDFTF